MDVSVQGHFGTMHSNIDNSADILALVPLCQNVHVQNILVPKSPSAITYREDII